MNFKPEMVEAILAGRKTVTRRPATSKARYEEGTLAARASLTARRSSWIFPSISTRLSRIWMRATWGLPRPGQTAFRGVLAIALRPLLRVPAVRRIEFRLVDRR